MRPFALLPLSSNRRFVLFIVLVFATLSTLCLLKLDPISKRVLIESCEVIEHVNKSAIESVDNKLLVTNEKQTVKCLCKNGKVAGTNRGKPACVSAYVLQFGRFCDMQPCLPDELCRVFYDRSGWRCIHKSKTTVVRIQENKREKIKVT
ncbi:chemokine-like protein TAFA-3 [Styela clava]|uniref:chemokine-like protein TAFA-3 n=1 Tax=Styela clava TaxID=7725 RepID=UPI00193ABCA5|nr:chemokine-like protein TAFA-3 [Styela clava]